MSLETPKDTAGAVRREQVTYLVPRANRVRNQKPLVRPPVRLAPVRGRRPALGRRGPARGVGAPEPLLLLPLRLGIRLGVHERLELRFPPPLGPELLERGRLGPLRDVRLRRQAARREDAGAVVVSRCRSPAPRRVQRRLGPAVDAGRPRGQRARRREDARRVVVPRTAGRTR